jgi:MG2 domain
MQRKHKLAIAGVGLVAALLLYWALRSPWPDHEGKLRQAARLEVSGLRRGGEGSVFLAVHAHYAKGGYESYVQVPELDSASLSLVDAAGAARPLPIKWDGDGGTRVGRLTLPDVPDGDYKLRASYQTELGKGELDAELPLYSPARIHVITDRPLYEAGNTVRFRAVVLRARDLVPLDGRPGRWIVRDPQGEVLLEEKAPAGDFGVVAGSFPLDRQAATGTWHVQWVSGGVTDDLPFTVQPFTLPRFRVDAAADQPFFSIGDVPVVRGAVVYSSGAPVAGAALEIEWQTGGDWPPPLEWREQLLPKTAKSDAEGRFELRLPQIPQDLLGRATLSARIAATDAAGDRVESQVSLLLSADKLQVSAVTELGEGLVEGFNNRLYLRVTTPDGRALPNTKIKVKRAWQVSDPGAEATSDEDGVAALQLDPGPPVNIVVPAMPWRPAPRPALVTRGEVDELIGGDGAPLEDQLEMDRWLPALAACGKWRTDESTSAEVGLRVNAGGAVLIAAAGAEPSPLDRCAAAVLRGKRLPAGSERMYALAFSFSEPDLPSLTTSVTGPGDVPEELAAHVEQLAADARDCLPVTAEGTLPRALVWRVASGSKQAQLGEWLADPNGDGAAASALGCVTSRLRGAAALQETAEGDAFGLIRFAVTPPERARAEKPQPTMMIGYELTVTAELEGGKDGAPSTKLRLTPGEIPPLRMRLTPVLAKAGEEVTAELIRGPSYTGDLPEKLSLSCPKQKPEEQKLDGERRAKWKLAADVTGWCEVQGGGVRALVYIKSPNELTVAVKPDKERYAPGDAARLEVQTQVAGRGAKAAVGLFGVDASLGQLAPLAGPSDMDRLQPKVETSAPAFGTLDGQALTLGRIRGANAAAATVLRVSSIPGPAELDAVVSTSVESRFNVLEELTDRFYLALGELYVQARLWEETAPKAEKMKPETMAGLWKKALAACEKRGEKIEDAYGRKLTLRRLPPDLLALTAPEAVITGTRLPEDVENWADWVGRRKP